MALGAFDLALGTGDHLAAKLAAVASHDLFHGAAALHHPPGSLLRDKQHIHIGQNLIDRFARFLLVPEIGAVVDIKRNRRASSLELFDHLDCGGPAVPA